MTKPQERVFALAATMARDLRGSSHATSAALVCEGKWPVAAVAVGESLLVLVRDHHSSISLSLPHEHSWPLRSVDEWPRIAVAVGAALAEYRTAHPHVTTLADAIVELRAILGAAWDASIPGVTVPTEAWLRCGEAAVGLFQQKTTVKVVVWVGDAMRSQACGSRAELAALGPWLAHQLADQRTRLAAEAAEKARIAALPPPSFDEVMHALESGVCFQTGGGRAYSTYSLAGSQLRVETFDEGETDARDIDEQTLRDAIARSPEAFRRTR